MLIHPNILFFFIPFSTLHNLRITITNNRKYNKNADRIKYRK